MPTPQEMYDNATRIQQGYPPCRERDKIEEYKKELLKRYPEIKPEKGF